MKLHFYVSSDDDAKRCRESFRFGNRIEIGGIDSRTGRVKAYKGVVLNMEAASAEVLGERWRITIESPVQTPAQGEGFAPRRGPA